MVVHGSYVDTLMNLGTYGPPSGDLETNLKAVAEQRQIAPFQAILPPTLLGVGNSTVWHAAPGSPERDRDTTLRRPNSFRIRYSALLFVHVLQEARRRYGDPTRNELRAALTTDLIDSTVAERLAHGVLLILGGDLAEKDSQHADSTGCAPRSA